MDQIMALLPPALKLEPNFHGPLDDPSITSFTVTGEGTTEAIAALEATMIPAPANLLAQELAKLAMLTKQKDRGIENKLLVTAYMEKLSRFPADAVLWAIRGWPDESMWFPSWYELKERIESRTSERVLMLEALRKQ